MHVLGQGCFFMQLYHTVTIVLGIGKKDLTGALPTKTHAFFLTTEWCEILGNPIKTKK